MTNERTSSMSLEARALAVRRLQDGMNIFLAVIIFGGLLILYSILISAFDEKFFPNVFSIVSFSFGGAFVMNGAIGYRGFNKKKISMQSETIPSRS
jgi:cellobiose-specific phosphotransferase system component IIC